MGFLRQSDTSSLTFARFLSPAVFHHRTLSYLLWRSYCIPIFLSAILVVFGFAWILPIPIYIRYITTLVNVDFRLYAEIRGNEQQDHHADIDIGISMDVGISKVQSAGT